MAVFAALALFSPVLAEATPIIEGDPFSFADSLGLSPFWDWKMFESEHFRVYFPESLASIAQHATDHLEEANRTLSPLFRWQPPNKTSVLIIDNSDSANGLTAPFARIGITLWVTPPENWFSTGYYDDWLRLLIFHEYTHFLNMDATHGYASIGRAVFGDVFLPNSLWYPWMLEGLAVFMETQFTHSGRGRSPYYEMVLRAGTLEQTLDTHSLVTLNQLSGTNPYFPGGDTRYQFGYHLMNQAAKQPIQEWTFDRETETTGNADLLGILSDRSSDRIPFFINSNLKNIVGNDWYQLWDEMILEAKERTNKEIQIIRSQPVTHYTLITERDHFVSNAVLGAAASPDGNWLAYTMGSADRRSGLYLKNLKTGETRRIDDKMNGMGMRFTPDSKALLYSELRQSGIYYTYSDLRVYFLDQDSSHALTKNARARDPDVSRDGKWAVFTITKVATTGLALAPLQNHDGDYALGPIEILYMPPLYDHVANPQFSADGQTIYFTLHRNGKSQEDLLQYDLHSHQVSTLVSDGSYNQFPAVDARGNLYFVSTKTGVNNLYLYRPSQDPALVTNMETGITAPTFQVSPPALTADSSASKSILYACVFSTSGWDLSTVEMASEPLSIEKATIPPLPQPPPITQAKSASGVQRKVGSSAALDSTATPHPSATLDLSAEDSLPASPYTIKDYSVFPSIWPRAWTPLFGWDANGVSLGGEIIGFDAIDLHRYLLAGSYSTALKTADAYAVYSNRSLGPTLSLSGGVLTPSADTSGSIITFKRDVNLNATLALPIPWTYSYLTPSIGASLQKVFEYKTGNGPGNNFGTTLNSSHPLVANIAGLLTYSNQETSNLSVAPEGGRYSQVGLASYLLNPAILKGIIVDREYFRLSKHIVLNPSLAGMWTSGFNQQDIYTNANLTGRTTQNILAPLFSTNFNQMALRGYPNYNYSARFASIGSMDLFFPISYIFSGWGTQPAFLDHLHGFLFTELGYIPTSTRNWFFPSAGGGIRLSGELFSVVSTTFSLEYHHGFRTDYGGASDLFFQVFVSAATF